MADAYPKKPAGVRGAKSLPMATISETAEFLFGVFLPNLAKGPIIRRPKAVAVASRLKLDDRAVRILQKLHRKYQTGPLLLRIPLRKQAIILQPEHVHFVLENSPDPFATASSEKRAALVHFEPKNVLISDGTERSVRRGLQEQVLDSASPVHQLADHFIPIVDQEAGALLRETHAKGELNWDDFIVAWFRVVRRVVFGDDARDDVELTDTIAQLRSDGNWAFLKPRNKRLRARFLARVAERLNTAAPGSLASVMANTPKGPNTAPAQQIPQWLFAFDPAGMATFRTLAVLATHPQNLARARQELAEDMSQRRHLHYLRACVLEALRLWPTTPMILRQTTQNVEWEDGRMAADCGILIYAPYFHRDDQHLPYAHHFTPAQWLDRDAADDWPLVPFSDGPAVCPGRQLVLMLTSAMLARLIEEKDFTLVTDQKLDANQPLPGTLNNYAVRLAVRPADHLERSTQPARR